MDELTVQAQIESLDGWRLETWYELVKPTAGIGPEVVGYFTDPVLVTVYGKGKGWYGADCTISEVIVLTKNGQRGYIIEKPGVDRNDDVLKEDAIEAVKMRFTPEELALLGIKSE